MRHAQRIIAGAGTPKTRPIAPLNVVIDLDGDDFEVQMYHGKVLIDVYVASPPQRAAYFWYHQSELPVRFTADARAYMLELIGEKPRTE